MEYRKIGRTDIEVSTVSTGCWAMAGGNWWGPQDEAEAVAAIEASLEVGINAFDTAENYGKGASEELLGRALGSRRKDVVITTKVGRTNLAAADVQAACERSLQRLQTDYIDLYQIHWPNREIEFEETMTALQKLVEQGKVRALAVSNFGQQDMRDMLQYGRFEANQVPYNLLWRAIEFEIQPVCVEHDIGIMPYMPLQQALLADKFANADAVPVPRASTRQFSSDRPNATHGESGVESEMFAAIDAIREVSAELDRPMAHVALAWLLHQPAVPSVIAGARNREQVLENAAAADLKLSADVLDRLDQITQDVKQKLGSNADMWNPAAETRYR